MTTGATMDFFDVTYAEASDTGQWFQSRFRDIGEQLRWAEYLQSGGSPCVVHCTTKKREIRESRRVPVRDGKDWYDIFIEQAPKVDGLSMGFVVWSIHSVGNGFYEVAWRKSLGAARDRAAQYVTVVCHGGLYDYDWRLKRWNASKSALALGKPEHV